MKLRNPRPSPSDPDIEIVGTESEEAIRAQWAQFHEQNFAEERPPPNAITAPAYAKLNDVTSGVAFQLLTRMQQKGTLKTGVYRVPGRDGTVRPTRHWWPATPCAPKKPPRTRE